MADLGCGSGTFTQLLRRAGYESVGLDISSKLLAVGRRKHPEIEFLQGDIEHLPFSDESFEGVLLSGVVHHFPDPSRCAMEVFRVLRPGGQFVAFDPNRRNPFMWLYRDPASPFYKFHWGNRERTPGAGVQCCRGIRACRLRGFLPHYLGGLAYRYVASARARLLLPIYNRIDAAVFSLSLMERFRPFVLTAGAKRLAQ